MVVFSFLMLILYSLGIGSASPRKQSYFSAFVEKIEKKFGQKSSVNQ